MHVTFASTYPPTACGLATFTQDLREAVGAVPDVETAIAAIKGEGEALGGGASDEVLFEMRRAEEADYAAAAEFISYTGTDVVSLQHEFGIFGGAEGGHVIAFLDALQKPVATTLHTVLADPPPRYRRALLAVADRSERLVVMSEKARALLCEVYGVEAERVRVVPHGVPDVPFEDPDDHKAPLGFEGRTVLLTFGLLGPSKGVEHVLEALPEVAEAHPEVLYVVLGATHPEVKRQQGEGYRRKLKRHVERLGIEENVRFVDKYVEQDELKRYLHACDVYVTPYPAREQICSGTLAYAVGAGKAVVSTPYFHAEELLAEGRGRLVGFEEVGEMSRALKELVADGERRHAMQKAAYAYGRQMTWPRVGERYAEVLGEVAAGRRSASGRRTRTQRSIKQLITPGRISLDHLAAITDDTGVFQHVAYGIPARAHGYCTDDAGRALVVALSYHARRADALSLRLARTYLSFLQHAQRPDGRFRNFMGFDRAFLDEEGSQDTLGRALWGLGAAVAWGPTPAMRVLARQMFERAMHAELHHPRALAYALCGTALFLERYAGSAEVRLRLRALADRLAEHYDASCEGGWHWFQDTLTYANAKLPEALLLAYRATGEAALKRRGLEALSFLAEKTYHDEQFDFIGNRGWYRRGERRAVFGQQPIEAGYMAEACTLAHEVTGEARYWTLAQAAVEWFFGRNRLGARLYDPETGACTDGFDEGGPNLNQGAESVIACLLGLLAVTQERPEEKRLDGRFHRTGFEGAPHVLVSSRF